MTLPDNNMRRLSFAVLLMALISCSAPTPLIEQIKAGGELLVVTRNSGTTLYQSAHGLNGFEYDLVNLFSDSIGVKPKFIIPDRFDQVLDKVSKGEAHLAAAGLSVTQARQTNLRFATPYQEITQQVVYLRGQHKPRKVEDLIGKQVEVIAGSSHEEMLNTLKSTYPYLEWTPRDDLEVFDLLKRVADGEIDYAIADSNEIAFHRHFIRTVRIGFDLTEPQSLAWALPHNQDHSLFKAVERFFSEIKKNGTLKQLIERHYGYVDRLDFVETRTFNRHVENRLPEYEKLFKAAADENEMDWRLLAAMGYQESHWNPKAKSPTGVRGIMMLTLAAAKDMKIKSRLDPEQSIMGGARYLKNIERRLPEDITQPDRIWMALAAYNIGFGHLEDARVLTERQGDDPDRWADVKKHLPKLSEKKWYSTVKRGYARGNEPVNYVDNIRAYYGLLTWREPEVDEPVADNQPEPPYGLGITSSAL